MGNVFEEYAEERLLETAINMLKEDFSIDTILKIIPSVSRDQILALEEQIKMQAAIYSRKTNGSDFLHSLPLFLICSSFTTNYKLSCSP